MACTQMEHPYYFAYGSNLNVADWRKYCARTGVEPDVIEAVGTAVLPDMQLSFDYFSASRGGGALNIRPARGHIVHGVLFRVSQQGWKTLDRKEGAPHCYKRIERVALRADGSRVSVITYEVTAAMRSDFCQPTNEYRQIVADGLQAWGLPVTGMLRAADNFLAQAEIDRVFVYGTLMRGEANARLIPARLIRELRLATVQGLLYDTGLSYPAMVLTEKSNEVVHGECLQIDQLPALLERLDELEGFRGYADPAPLYHRTLIEAGTRKGDRQRAWCYVSASKENHSHKVESGCWRTHSAKA